MMSLNETGLSAAPRTQLAGVEAIDLQFAGYFAADEPSELADTWWTCLLALSFMNRQGHTCLDLQEIAGKTYFDDASQGLPGLTFATLSELIQAVKWGCALSETSQHALVYEGGKLFTRRFWQFETDIAQAITQRRGHHLRDDTQVARLQALWPQLFDTTLQSGQDWQQIAVATTLSRHFSVINGGPGTGKTYTVTRLIAALQSTSDTPLRIQLAAPTGKAAQRLNESLASSVIKLLGAHPELGDICWPDEAVTLHRLLGVGLFGVETRVHADKPLQCDVLIIDEASMVDCALMARVCRALKPHCRLILVGDAQQLPAVESGSVLESLTRDPDNQVIDAATRQWVARLCPHLPLLEVREGPPGFVSTLKISQRFGGELADAARAIQQGDADDLLRNLSTQAQPQLHEDGVSLCEDNEDAPLRTLAVASFTPLSKAESVAEAMTALNRCRWLTPVRQGPMGVTALNRLVETALGRPVSSQGHYAGRPVMVVENFYAQNLFNGDVGVIWPDENGQLKAWFDGPDGNYRSVALSRLPSVETVYAMTIHKSQGSEFEQVVIMVPDAESANQRALCHRGLLYTGLTRAKRAALMVGTAAALREMIHRRDIRHSGLTEKLQQLNLSEPGVD